VFEIEHFNGLAVFRPYAVRAPVVGGQWQVGIGHRNGLEEESLRQMYRETKRLYILRSSVPERSPNRDTFLDVRPRR